MSFSGVATSYTPLFLYWELDEASGTSFADGSGSARDGTGTGSFTYQTLSQFTTPALGFNGAELVTVSSTGFQKGTNAWAFSVCFKTTATGVRQLASYGGWQLHLVDTGFFRGLTVTDPSGAIVAHPLNSGGLWSDGTWHMVSLVRTSGAPSSATLKVYLDGVLKATVTNAGSLPTTGSTTVCVGGCTSPAVGSSPWDGDIDAVLVPKTNVTLSEWATLWNARDALSDTTIEVVADGFVVNSSAQTLDLIADGYVFDTDVTDDPEDERWWAGDPIFGSQGNGTFSTWYGGDAPVVLDPPEASGTTLDLTCDGFIPHEVVADGYVVAPATLDLIADGLVVNGANEVIADGIVAGSNDGGRAFPRPAQRAIPDRVHPVVP